VDEFGQESLFKEQKLGKQKAEAWKWVSIHTAHPKASGRNALTIRAESFCQEGGMLRMHPLACPKNLKLVIKAEECLEQVLLIPEPVFIQDPWFWVFGWKENIMNVD
jgi:hypothetical protein